MKKNTERKTPGNTTSAKASIGPRSQVERSRITAKKAIAIEYPCPCGAKVLALHTALLTDVTEDDDEPNSIVAKCRCTFKCAKCELEVLESVVPVSLYHPPAGECCQWEFIDGSGDTRGQSDIAPYVTAQTHGRNFYGGRAAEREGDFYLAFVVHMGCEQCGETDMDGSVHAVDFSDFKPVVKTSKSLARNVG